MTHGKFSAPLAAGILLLLLPGTAAGAVPRGEPGSQDRTAWCNAQHLKCLGDVEENCTKEYPQGGASLDACLHGGADSCNSSWGGKSDCTTRQISPGGGAGPAPKTQMQDKPAESQKGILGKPTLQQTPRKAR